MTKNSTSDGNRSALIYCRVSTKGQAEEGASLETQEEECRRYAEANGYTVARVYHEVYSGAELFDRPQLNEMREAVSTGHYAAVIVHKIDRLTRAQGLTIHLLNVFERYGCWILSVLDPLENTPTGKFILSAKEFVAEVEREQI